jgi:hypothetical protein
MIVCPAQPTAPDMAGVIQVKQFLDDSRSSAAGPCRWSETETVAPTVDGIDTLMQTMGGGSALPALDPTDPSLKTETKRIWSRVKKDEKRAQLGEVQRTSIAMPLEVHTQVRVAAVQRPREFQRLGHGGGTTASRA